MILYPFAFINTRILTELDAGNSTSYPGTGTAWYDLSGYDNTGTLVNSPAFSSLGASSYFTFDGTNQAATVASLNLQKDFTLSGWFNPNVLNGFALFGQGTTAANVGLHIFYISNTVIRFGMFANDTDFTVSTSINNWYYISCTYNNSSPYVKQLYINGVAQTGSVLSAAAYAGTGILRLGATFSTGGAFGNGLYAGLTVNNSVLSAAQILQDYNDLKDRYSLVTSGLIMQLDANNSTSYPGTGTTVYDLTGAYNHTLTTATFTTLSGVKCFDENSGSIRVNGTGPTLPTSGYTYVTWARIKTSSATWRTLLRATPNDHTILVETGTDNLGFYDNDTAGFKDSGYDVTPIEDVWAQYSVVGDSSSATFYINGAQVGSSVAFGAGGNAHDYWGYTSQEFGYLANLYLYNRKLSATEITQNYTSLVARFV